MSAAADLVLLGGQVLTQVPGVPPRQALAVRGGTVLAVGSDAEVMATIGPRTRRIELQGRTVLPGLIDAHAHMEREGLKTLRPSLAHATSVADVLAVVAAEARRVPKGQWIVTMPVGQPPFYFGGPDTLADKRMPTRDELDAAAPDHPVYIPGHFGNWGVPPSHSALNTRALAVHGLDADIEACPDCAGVQLERDAQGRPTGRIVEHNKRPLLEFALLTRVPAFTFEDRVEGLRRSLPLYHAFGTTSVYEGHGSAPETIAVYRHLWERGELTMRTHLCVSPTWSNAAEARVAMRDWLGYARGRGLGDPLLNISGVYIGLGGEPATAAAARRALPNTGWSGFVEWANSLEDFRDQAWLAAEFDLRLHSVVVDRLAEVLQVLEAIDARFPLRGRRWVLEHVGHVSDADIRRLAALGVLVTTIPFYMLWKNGFERLRRDGFDAERFVPQRALLEAGIPVAAASDNIPVSLFWSLWSSVTRVERTTGQVLGAGQALSREQALATVTRNGAWLSFEEDRKGTLQPGRFADVAVLDTDPLTAGPDALARTRAVLTLVGGRTVHEQRPSGTREPG